MARLFPSQEWRFILAVICMEGEGRLLRAVLPSQLAEGDAQRWRFLLPLHPAFLPLSASYQRGQREPRGVQIERWSRCGWLLGAGSKRRSGGWWNKRLVGKEKRPGREHEMLEKLWKRAQKKGSGIKTLKVQCRIFLA